MGFSSGEASAPDSPRAGSRPWPWGLAVAKLGRLHWVRGPGRGAGHAPRLGTGLPALPGPLSQLPVVPCGCSAVPAPAPAVPETPGGSATPPCAPETRAVSSRHGHTGAAAEQLSMGRHRRAVAGKEQQPRVAGTAGSGQLRPPVALSSSPEPALPSTGARSARSSGCCWLDVPWLWVPGAPLPRSPPGLPGPGSASPRPFTLSCLTGSSAAADPCGGRAANTRRCSAGGGTPCSHDGTGGKRN